MKFWGSAAELPGLVSLNLSHAMNAHSAVGWVRADRVASAERSAKSMMCASRMIQLQKQAEKYRALVTSSLRPPRWKTWPGWTRK